MVSIYDFKVYPKNGIYLGCVPKHMKVKAKTFTAALKQITDKGIERDEIRQCEMPNGLILYSDKFDQVSRDEYREWKENKNRDDI